MTRIPRPLLAATLFFNRNVRWCVVASGISSGPSTDAGSTQVSWLNTSSVLWSDTRPLTSREVDSLGIVTDGSMFSYHKALFPLDGSDILCFLIAAACLVVAAGGGIGGGGILVPLYMIFLQFRPKHAVALSNFTILGGSLANTFLNAWKTDALGRSLIDWDIIVMMEPSTIAGTVIGSFCSKYFPDFLLTLLLATVLGLLAFRTLDKGIQMYRREDELCSEVQVQPIPMEEGEDQEFSDEDRRMPESQMLIDDAAQNGLVRTVGPGTPLHKVGLLISCLTGCVVLTVLKGNGSGSILGVECGSFSFWVVSFATIPWVMIFGSMFRKMLIMENDDKEQDGHIFGTSEIRWDARTTIKYPLLCTLAGILAGIFGVGGGIVKGPLMLEMGVHPLTASATAATMILFTSSAASVSFEVFGLLEHAYGGACFMLGFACTMLGQWVVNTYMKAAKRQSPPVLSIGLVMALSTFLVVLQALGKLVDQKLPDLMVPSSLCSTVN